MNFPGGIRVFGWIKWISLTLFTFSVMREDLLGYLLGALEPDEMEQVRHRLKVDPEARRQLAELEEMLRPLHEQQETIEPPPSDLVSRTLAQLPPLPAAGTEADERTHSVDAFADREAFGAESLDETDDRIERVGAGNDRDVRRGSGPPAMHPVRDLGGASAWSWRDWTASVVAASVVMALILPALLEGRFLARRQACQENLRQLGVGMTQFVTYNAQSRLPAVEPHGHLAFAGVYAAQLDEAGLLSNAQWRWCPSIDPDAYWRKQNIPTREPYPEAVTLAMLDEAAARVRRAAPEPAAVASLSGEAIRQLRQLQQTAGGHYAYTLGIQDGDVLVSPKFEGRSSFAVMSDVALSLPADVTAPVSRLPEKGGAVEAASADWSSATVDRYPWTARPLQVLSHDGRGINVLYEDGRVHFLPTESLYRIPDHPLLNHEGRVEAGVNLDDAALGPSWQPPFIESLQR